jgi:RHS repeat-associated protein
MRAELICDCTSSFVHSCASTASRYTGKERDQESGLDYFGARYYGSSMGRWMRPDWSAKEDPVPYSSLGDPQSLNLYQFVRNNPLSNRDADGHGCPPDCGDPTVATQIAPPSRWDTAKDFFSLPFTNDYTAGAGKILIGGGLVATAAFGDVPGGAAGALLVVNTVLGGTATAVSGTTQIVGAATNTNTTEAREALSATSTVPGLVTAAATGGNLKAAGAVSTLTNAATLGAKPAEAFKNPATMADAAQTTKETTSLFRSAVNVVKSFFVPPPPPPQQQH